MAEIKNGLLLNNDRVFLPSTDINVFPCSRRGQANIEDIAIENSATYYDPEARLNTERTNRLHTALNGFTDSFIESYDAEAKTLVFVLAGYYVEIKNFDPAIIASTLGESIDKIYAHLRLHDHVSLGVKDYFTEMLYRQSESELDSNYLDVTYTINGDKGDFFVGVSFTKEPVEDHLGSNTLPSHNLLLFSKDADSSWQLEQTSLLPKIEHGTTKDSVKIWGDLIVPVLKTDTITSDSTAGLTIDNKLTVTGATIVNNTITAKKVVIPSNIDADGVEKGEIVTPQVRVNRITSNEGSITVDNKKLIVNKSLEMLAKADATEPAKATIEQAVIGDLTVKVDANLKNSTGKVTAKEVAAEKITQNGNPVPSIKIVPVDDAYQLQFTLNASKN